MVTELIKLREELRISDTLLAKLMGIDRARLHRIITKKHNAKDSSISQYISNIKKNSKFVKINKIRIVTLLDKKKTSRLTISYIVPSLEKKEGILTIDSNTFKESVQEVDRIIKFFSK